MEQDKKSKILIAAAELISTEDYYNVSVREICKAAGVTKPVLYYYFKDKEDVLAELIKEGHSRFRELINKNVIPKYSFEEKIDGLCNVYVNYVENYLYLIRISAHVQISTLPNRIKKLSLEKSTEIMEILKSIFTKGLEEKYFDKGADLEMLVYSLLAPVAIYIAQSVLFKNDVKPLKTNLKKYFKFWKTQFLTKKK
ncbi:MAG: TetR/AcrR family transcriptional regulator [Ignavibacteriales bacterium]|nr:TetR/AcrR family transcriptional regulator [Ignavibacteriales bacterium]